MDAAVAAPHILETLRDRRLEFGLDPRDGAVMVGFRDALGGWHWTCAGVDFSAPPDLFQAGVLAAVERLTIR